MKTIRHSLFNRILCFVIISVASMDYVQPQSYPATLIQEVVPPSPNASALAKYGMVPVSPFTGASNIHIPLYSHSGKQGFRMDVGLDYHTGGIRVDDVASNVGIGWALLAGGAITRTMVGVPDDLSPYGYHYAPELTASHALDYYRGVEDSEPDVFHYNFNGHVGSFYLSKATDGGELLQLTPDGLKITYTKMGGSSTGLIESFTVTTGQGVRYHFSERETSSFFNQHIGSRSYTSTWMLSYIELPYSNKRIDFNYENYSLDYVTSQTETMHLLYAPSDLPNPLLPNRISTQDNRSNISYCKRLLAIDFGDSEKVLFRYHTIRSDLTGDRMLDSVIIAMGTAKRGFHLQYSPMVGRPALHSVHEFSDGEAHPPYIFTYNSYSTLPERLSKSQDFWGFHNGRLNTNLVAKLEPFEKSLFQGVGVPSIGANAADRRPDTVFVKSGMLTRVEYPTGGRTDFDYEIHTTADREKIPYVDYRLMSTFINGTESLRYKTIKLENDYDALKLEFNFKFRDYPYGVPNTYVFSFFVKDITGSTTYASAVFDYSHNNGGSFKRYNTLPMNAGEYRIYWSSNYPVFPLEDPFLFVLEYNDFVTDTVELTNQHVGGVRIRSVTDYDHNGTKASTKTYKYVKQDGTSSSGRLFYKPFYSYRYERGRTDLGKQQKYFVKTSYPIHAATYLSGGHIGYERVIEREVADGESKGETHYAYDVGSTAYSDYIYPFAPMDHRPWRNGSLLEKKIFNGAGELLKKETVNYLDRDVTALEGIKLGIKYFDLLSADNHRYALMMFHLPCGYRLPYSNRTVTFHPGGDSTVTVTEHQYRDWPTFNPSTPLFTSSTTSDGGLETVYTSYPHDYANTTGFLADMKSNHLTGYPIEQVRYKELGGTKLVLSGGISTYKTGGEGLVDQVFSLEIPSPLAQSSFKFGNRSLGQLPAPSDLAGAFVPDMRYKLRAVHDLYDADGNVLQITRTEHSPVSFIWGYGGRYPVAKIENATYAEVAAILGQPTIDNLNAVTVSDITIRTAMNTLRKHPNMQKAQVSSYTYKPLVGMTSKTDARGITEHYEYDGFQRLKDVLDFDKYVLKNYQYHYRP